jgi:hypothetical protein
MSGKPTLTEAAGRAAVREVLALAPGWWKPLRLIERGVAELTGVEAAVESLLRWIEWNRAKGYVEHRVNEDSDEHEWNITRAGVAKEEIR